jgi:Spy/CpxP family protein refolding chaperone
MLIVAVFAAFTIPGFAGDKCCKSGHAHMKMAKCGVKGDCCGSLLKELNLTEKQQAQLDKMKKECVEVQKKLYSKIEKLTQKKCELMCADKKDKKAVFKTIEELAKLKVEQQKHCFECMLKVNSVFTPEQLKKMKELKAKCKTKAKGCCKAKGHKEHHGHGKEKHSGHEHKH